jgi:hypothetical protein
MKRHAPLRIRWGAALAAAVLVALLLTAAAATAPGDPTRRHTAADQMLARSLVLRKADLPTGAWKTSPTDVSQPNPPCLLRHYRLDSLTETGGVGYTYSLADLEIESDASIFMTAAQASRAFATESQPGFMHCVITSLSSPNVTVKIKTVESLPPHSAYLRSAANHSLVYMHSTKTNRTVVFDFVTLFLQRGRAISGVSIIRTMAHIPKSLVDSTFARATLNLRKL